MEGGGGREGGLQMTRLLLPEHFPFFKRDAGKKILRLARACVYECDEEKEEFAGSL